MPNTQTSVPAFVAAQVLTAQQQTEINTGIPVFATTVTRDAAFGGAGEKALAEGQFAYIEATNATQYYDGAAWQAVGASSGLVFITGASFSTATSFSLPANTFSSTYSNYKIIIDLTTVSADSNFTIRLRAAGADETSALYQSMFLGVTAANVANNLTGNNQTSWNVGLSDISVRYALSCDIIAPQATNATKLYGNFSFVNFDQSANIGCVGSSYYSATTSYDSLSFISSVASSITGSYKVYGYANS